MASWLSVIRVSMMLMEASSTSKRFGIGPSADQRVTMAPSARNTYDDCPNTQSGPANSAAMGTDGQDRPGPSSA